VLGAKEALALGLVVELVPGRRLEVVALGRARRLASLEPALVLGVRRCLRAAHDLPLAAGCELERRVALALQGRP
jgi:enoyl-CoA hydratase/carnithine racemase